MSVFNNKKHHHYLGLYLILVIILAVAVKADINYLLFKIKGKSQNSYEFTASLNSNSNKYAHDYTVNFPNTKFLIDFNGMLRNILHQKQMNNVTKLNNNYLTILNKQLTPKELDIRAERLAKLNEICKKNNIHFLFLQPSCQHENENMAAPQRSSHIFLFRFRRVSPAAFYFGAATQRVLL